MPDQQPDKKQRDDEKPNQGKPRGSDLIVEDDDGQTRRRYLVAARKIRRADRDVSGPVLRGRHARYLDIMSSDDDEQVPVGANVAYAVYLTDDEAERFREASNLRALDLDVDVPPAYVTLPPPATLAWMNASLTQQGTLTGAGVKVAVLDGGTSDAVRAQCSWTVVAERIFPTGGVRPTGDHGCKVSPEAVPPAGQLIEGMIANPDGSGSYTNQAAGIIWACDQGAKVINISFGGFGDIYKPPQALRDACAYARDRGVQITISAGNDGLAGISWPAALTREYPNVHAIGAIDKATNAKASFSNYDADLAGMTPGVAEPSLDVNGNPVNWNGTSCAAPLAAQLIALLCTGGTYTPQQAADALRSTARDLGLGVAVQGRGAWSLSHAKAALATPPVTGGLMKAHATSLQVIPPSSYTRCKFHSLDLTDQKVSINNPRDVWTYLQAGRYLTKFSARWVGHTEGPGDRFAALGPNIDWASPGGRLWSNWSSEGDDTGLGFTLIADERVPAGQQACAWMWHSAPYGWGVDFQIAHPDNWVTNLTVEYQGP